MVLEILYFVLFITFVNFITGFKKSNVFGCGLVGFSGTGSFDINIIRVLLWHNSLTRGKHATGIFNPSTGIIKDAVEAKDFFKSDKYKALQQGDNVLMGHVRHATVGDLKDPKSAHPWDFGNNVMMHNGTLKNYEELANQYGIKKEEYSVDSQVLGLALQKNIEDSNGFKVLSEYIGAAAVIMYNKSRESLFVYRDTERPLFYGYLNDTEMYISSLEDILEIVGCTNIRSFEPFKVHEIKNGKILSKMHIKRKTANRNNIFTKVVECIKDIIKYTLYSSDKLMLSEDNFTGFDNKVVKAEYLLGYTLRSITTVSPNSILAKLSKDKHYKIDKVIDDKNVTVVDDNKDSMKANIHMFDFRNFIPVKGSYVTPLVNVVHAKGDFKIGELYEVVYFKYGLDTIILRNHVTDNVISIALSNVRKATDQEVNKYFKDTCESSTCTVKPIDLKTENKNKESVVAANRNSIITLPSSLNKNTDIEDAVLVDDDSPIDEALDIDSVNNLIMDNQHTALKLADKAVSEIIDKYYKVSALETYSNLCKLRLFVNKCVDSESNFLYNVNENSYINLEISDGK